MGNIFCEKVFLFFLIPITAVRLCSNNKGFTFRCVPYWSALFYFKEKVKMKKTMKKIMAIFLAVVMTASFASCGLLGLGKSQQAAVAKSSYERLTALYETCEALSDIIYEAWSFAIYDAYSYNNARACAEAISKKIGANYDIFVKNLNAEIEYNGKKVSASTQLEMMKDFNHMLSIVICVIDEYGFYADGDAIIELVAKDIRKLNDKYEDVTGYSDLKKYYVAVEEYYNFVKSPSGSLLTYEGTVSGFEKEAKDLQKSLKTLFI